MTLPSHVTVGQLVCRPACQSNGSVMAATTYVDKPPSPVSPSHAPALVTMEGQNPPPVCLEACLLLIVTG